jgi:hypothetical protein
MKITGMSYDRYATPPLLTLYVHGHPHKRQHREVIQVLREEMWRVAQRRIGKKYLPITEDIDLKILYTNPNSPDLDHLIEATFMALDGKTLRGPSILANDRQIQAVNMAKYYPNDATKRDGER